MKIILGYWLPQADYSKGLSNSSAFLRFWEELRSTKDWAILLSGGSVLFSAMPGSLVLTFAQDKHEQDRLENLNVLLKA